MEDKRLTQKQIQEFYLEHYDIGLSSWGVDRLFQHIAAQEAEIAGLREQVFSAQQAIITEGLRANGFEEELTRWREKERRVCKPPEGVTR